MAYNPDIAQAICIRLAEGESLRKASTALGVAASTVLEWVGNPEHAEFAERYAQARARGYELLADEILEISDDGANDSYVDDDGNVRTNAEVVARSRLRVDSRKWMLSKITGFGGAAGGGKTDLACGLRSPSTAWWASSARTAPS
jgi:hypothetical protein